MGRVSRVSMKSLSLGRNGYFDEQAIPLPKKLKYLTITVLFYGSFVFGCAFNTYGPSLTSMQHKFGTDDATISTVFSILTGSYMVGALTAGLIYNYINRQVAVIIIMSTMATIMFATPHIPTLTIYFVSASIMGFCCGAYDTAQVVWVMEMFQKDCPPFVQGQHFFYGLGPNLASLLMAPFLNEKEDELVTDSPLGLPSYVKENVSSLEATTKKEEGDLSKLFIPYTVIGTLVAMNAVGQILLFIFMRYYPPPPEKLVEEEFSSKAEEAERNVEEAPGFKIGGWPLAKLRMVILCAIFFGAYQGCEMTTFEFFPKFGQNSKLHLSESESTYVLTGMTAAYAAGRGAAIFLVLKISSQFLLVGNIILLLIANIILIGWAQNSLPILWACSIIFGLGFSSMYGGFCSFIERYLNFTNFIGSMMVVCASGTAAIYPLIIGNFIEENPTVLSYTAFFSIILLTTTVGTLSYLTHKDKTRY